MTPSIPTHLVFHRKDFSTQIVHGALSGRWVGFGMDYKHECGKRIRKARDALGWTLTELSEQTSHVLSPSRISNYEQGLRLLKQKEAVILGAALNQDPGHLLCMDTKDLTPDERDLLRNWRALPENERVAYLRRITALALTYREPLPDERLSSKWSAKASPQRRKAPRKSKATQS